MKLDKTKIKARVDSLKVVKELRLKKELAEIMSEVDETSGRPGSKFSPGRDRAGMTFIPAGTGTGSEMTTRPGPGLASSRPGPGP